MRQRTSTYLSSACKKFSSRFVVCLFVCFPKKLSLNWIRRSRIPNLSTEIGQKILIELEKEIHVEKNKPEVKQTNNNSNKIHSLIANIIL